MGEKKLTVITWDANYRGDYVERGLECLNRQTIKDDIEFIHIEWGDKLHPAIEECDFVQKHCLNIPFRGVRPSFDTGIQWNYGLHIAETEWVSYCHFDIIPPDFYEKMVNQMEEIKNKQLNIIFLEGWYINHHNTPISTYEKWCKDLGDDFNLLPYKFTPKRAPMMDGIGATVKKKEFIDDCGGWPYNMKDRQEWWIGVGYPQPRFRGKGIRGYLLETKRSMCKHPDLVAFKIPHPSSCLKTDKREGPLLESGGLKNYNNFVQQWVPKLLPTIIK